MASSPSAASPATAEPSSGTPQVDVGADGPASEVPLGSFGSFLASQLGWVSSPASDELSPSAEPDSVTRRRAGVYNFLQVPWNLEPLLLFGYATCLDCFLQHLTFLPLRVLGAVVTLVRGRQLTATQSCDMLRALLIGVVSALLLKIDMSHTYHSVRNQATLKLYVIFNLLEVFDKLCASFGQDILESLFDAASRPRRWRGGLLLDFLIALVYIMLHTMVLFYHAVALNIALNSHNNILITLLISNNFVELKGNVFKKCERENLFQVACADVVERFQVSVYLSIVALQFVFVQKVEATTSEVYELAMSFGLILVSELLVDWIKHAFVIKFNRISPTVYSSFVQILCADARKPADAISPNSRDAAQAAHKPPPQPSLAVGESPGEYSAPVAARMGFVPLPLLCLVIRVVGHDVAPRLYLGHPSGWLVCLLIWLVLCFVKVLTSITLLGYACSHADEQKADGLKGLQNIARYTLHGKRIM